MLLRPQKHHLSIFFEVLHAIFKIMKAAFLNTQEMISLSSFPILCMSLKNLLIHIQPFCPQFPLRKILRQLNVECESCEMRRKSTKKANDCHYKDSCYAMVNHRDNSGDTMPKAESKGFKKVDFFYVKFWRF